jgi:hypothetical protein
LSVASVRSRTPSKDELRTPGNAIIGFSKVPMERMFWELNEKPRFSIALRGRGLQGPAPADAPLGFPVDKARIGRVLRLSLRPPLAAMAQNQRAALVEDPMATTLANKTIERCRGNLEHLDASRRLLAHSRRLLNRAWRIAGGSDDDLRLTIRERLANAALFPAPRRLWAGPGTGRTCVVCGTNITAPEIEHEIVLGQATIWAHLPCYTIWREESERLNESGHTEAADYLASLRRIVSARLKSGTLLVILDKKSRVGRGVNALCVVCDKAIFAEELSQEPVGSRYRAQVHILCYRAWSEESKAARRANGGLHASV